MLTARMARRTLAAGVTTRASHTTTIGAVVVATTLGAWPIRRVATRDVALAIRACIVAYRSRSTGRLRWRRAWKMRAIWSTRTMAPLLTLTSRRAHRKSAPWTIAIWPSPPARSDSGPSCLLKNRTEFLFCLV